MKLLVDMNLSPRWSAFLSVAGINAVHWSVLGAATAQDAEITGFARGNGYMILTRDLDFGAILAAENSVKPSVIQIRAQDSRPSAIGDQVIAALRRFSAELEAGALVTVSPTRTRWRLLPV